MTHNEFRTQLKFHNSRNSLESLSLGYRVATLFYHPISWSLAPQDYAIEEIFAREEIVSHLLDSSAVECRGLHILGNREKMAL